MFLILLKFILAVPFIFILPGFFLLLAIFGWKNSKISFFEKAVLVVPMSILSVDFLVLLLNRMKIIINSPVLIGTILAFSILGYVIFQYRSWNRTGKNQEEKGEIKDFFNFSYWETIFVLISLFLAIFIRATYLSDTIVPSATDLGHHMYWSQTIVDTGRLPDYGMPDFIVGEHIIFAVVNLVSGASLMSAMPALVLLLINIVGIFALAMLAGRMFDSTKIAAVIFFVTGVLYAINAPQGKYVSGGVVGNIIGNMLIPVILYFLFRALSEKNLTFAGLFVFSLAGLLYIHHLSSFILLYSIAAITALYLIFNIDRIWKIILSWIKVFLKPFPIIVLLFAVCYFLFIFTPSYFNPKAVAQATGTPIKITRIGLDLNQIGLNAGSARFILGILGLALLLAALKRKEYKYSFALAWAIILFLMSWKPGWLYVNIPSNRIGNYLYLPFSLLSAYGLVEFFNFFRKSATAFFSTILLFILLFFVITDGLSDSAEAFKVRPQFQEAMETFHSARYLADKLDTSRDILLKDHVNIYGDSWYKLFFMKDYKYPLSRGNLSRYSDLTKPRETCTRDIISDPESEKGQACFADTGVNYVVLNAPLEGDSFEKYPEFSKVYASNYISVFRRN